MEEFNFDNIDLGEPINFEEPVFVDFGPDVEIFAISPDGENIAALSAYFDGQTTEVDLYAFATDDYSSVGGTVISVTP